MTGDCHVRICEGVGVKLPCATRLLIEFRLAESIDSSMEVVRHSRELSNELSIMIMRLSDLNYCEEVSSSQIL